MKTTIIWPPPSFLIAFQYLPLILFKNINDSLLQDSLFVSISRLDAENKMIIITCTGIVEVHKIADSDTVSTYQVSSVQLERITRE